MSRTPRTLAECRFTTGYGIASPAPVPRLERVLGVVVALVVGVLGALAIVHWAAGG